MQIFKLDKRKDQILPSNVIKNFAWFWLKRWICTRNRSRLLLRCPQNSGNWQNTHMHDRNKSVSCRYVQYIC